MVAPGRRWSTQRAIFAGAVAAVVIIAAGCSSTSSSTKVAKPAVTEPMATSTTIFNGNGPTAYVMPTGADAQTMAAACSSLGSLQAVFGSVASSGTVAPLASVPTSQGSAFWNVEQLATATTSSQIAQVRSDAAGFIKAWQSNQTSPQTPPASASGPAIGLAMINETMMAWSQLKVDCGSYGLPTT